MDEAIKEAIPWQRRAELGFFKAFWETIKGVLFKPVDFFEELEIKDSYLEPLLFYLTVTLASVALAVLIGALFTGSKAAAVITLLIGFIFIALAVSAGIYIWAAILHLSVLLLAGKDRSGFKATFHVLAYASAASVFFIIPFIGQFISSIWTSILTIIGLRKVHSITTARAIFIYLGPAIFGFLIGLVAAATIPGVLRARLTVNQDKAKASVVAIAKAIDSYAAAKGEYPEDELALKYASPPYLADTYDKKDISGYSYSVQISHGGYKIIANPLKCRLSGNKIFTLESGKDLSEQDCSEGKNKDLH